VLETNEDRLVYVREFVRDHPKMTKSECLDALRGDTAVRKTAWRTVWVVHHGCGGRAKRNDAATTCSLRAVSADTCSTAGLLIVEPMTGIEPAYSAWEADVLPLNYIGTPGCAGDPEG
jgi:hypothetical protein